MNAVISSLDEAFSIFAKYSAISEKSISFLCKNQNLMVLRFFSEKRKFITIKCVFRFMSALDFFLNSGALGFSSIANFLIIFGLGVFSIHFSARIAGVRRELKDAALVSVVLLGISLLQRIFFGETFFSLVLSFALGIFATAFFFRIGFLKAVFISLLSFVILILLFWILTPILGIVFGTIFSLSSVSFQ